MSDNDLLELAAKAAGIALADPIDSSIPSGGLWVVGRNGCDQVWNPLADDGDALRLAVKLCMHVECSKGYQHVSVYGHAWRISECHDGINPEAATRRAIVRAAAEIGKDMP